MALTDEERHAQRVLVGLVNAGGPAAHMDSEGWHVHRDPRVDVISVPAEEITEHYETLGVPYSVRIVMLKAPRTKSPRAVFDVFVDNADLPTLVRWVPSLQRLIDHANGQ